jgi:hypothetical protein
MDWERENDGGMVKIVGEGLKWGPWGGKVERSWFNNIWLERNEMVNENRFKKGKE